MAKKKTNKSQFIRDALKANPGKTPIEISELLKGQGHKVPPQYVSNIKAQAKAKRGKKRGNRSESKATGYGFEAVDAALALVKTSGGIEGARKALTTLEEIARDVGKA